MVVVPGYWVERRLRDRMQIWGLPWLSIDPVVKAIDSMAKEWLYFGEGRDEESFVFSD